jgi:hypothetical protein
LFLEGQEIFFRPDVPEGQRVKRLRVPVAETTRLEASGRELIVEHRGETMRFTIDHPERWVAKIRTPKSRVDKLGIRAGTVVYIHNVKDGALDDELSATLAVKKKTLGPEVDVVLYGASTESDLSDLSAIAEATKDTVALWVLWTKASALEAAALAEAAAADQDDQDGQDGQGERQDREQGQDAQEGGDAQEAGRASHSGRRHPTDRRCSGPGRREGRQLLR